MNEYLQKFRAQYPEYGDMSDADLAKALHAKFYQDISFPEFADKIGLSPDAAARDAAEQRIASGGNAVTDFLHMAAEGATLGMGDKLAGLGAAVIPGGKGYREGASAFQQRTDDLQLMAPGASKMAGAAGMVGLGGAVRAIQGLRAGAAATPLVAGALPLEYGKVVSLATPAARRTALEALRALAKNPAIRGAIGATAAGEAVRRFF